MKVEYLGHSCFKLTESTGISVVTDPYSSEIGYEMPKVDADIVTISHGHYDHDNRDAVGGNPVVLDEATHLEKDGITVTGVESYHDECEGAKRGKNVVYKFRMDGVDICHLGDVGHECTLELVESLLPVNVLLIPIGGKFTIDAEEAFDYVEKLMPDIVIPMHYKTKSLNLDIDKPNEFLDMFDEENIEKPEGCELMIDRNDINTAVTKVIVLKRQKS